jgi:hypothetical protein
MGGIIAVLAVTISAFTILLHRVRYTIWLQALIQRRMDGRITSVMPEDVVAFWHVTVGQNLSCPFQPEGRNTLIVPPLII